MVRASDTHEKSRPSVFWPLAAIIVPAVGLLARIEIIGAEKLPRRGAFVLAPNHNSEIDPLIVAVAVWRIGRAPRFLAKESLFRVPVLGWALRATGMVPVARATSATAAKQSLRSSQELVTSGRGVIVYPEGSLTRDPDMWPMRGKTGAVRLARGADIPLIPVAHWGVQDIMPRYGKLRLWPPRRHVRVLIGDPLEPADNSGLGPAALTGQTDTLMAAISDLLGQLRGLTPPEQRWNPNSHGQAETGRLDS